MAITAQCVAGERQVGWLSSHVLTCPFFNSPTAKAPQYLQRSLRKRTALSRCDLLMVSWANPRSQYWRYSEQTRATIQFPLSGEVSAGQSPDNLSRARASSA